MPLTDMAKLEEKRKEILKQSMENANEPKFGYFGYTAPLAVGENSKAPRFKKMKEEEFKKPNIQAAANKKGMTVDTLFSMATPLCVGDPYKRKAGAVKRDGKKTDDERPPFRPGGGIKFEPIEYKPQGNFTGGTHKVRKKVEPNIKPNIVTSATKRGGGGVYTPGVLFGQPPEKGESKTDRLFWEYVPDDYNIRSKLRRKELKEIEARKMHERAFAGCGYGNGQFSNAEETYHYDQPYGIPRAEKKFAPTKINHEQPFRPNGGIKTGHDACCSPFPDWKPDPIPMPAKRKRKAADGDDDKQAWRVGAPSEHMNPQPAVQMITRNLRSEFPKSFMRKL